MPPFWQPRHGRARRGLAGGCRPDADEPRRTMTHDGDEPRTPDLHAADATDAADVVDVVVIETRTGGLATAGELARTPWPELETRSSRALDAEEGPGGAGATAGTLLTIGRGRWIADLPRFPTGDLDRRLPATSSCPLPQPAYEGGARRGFRSCARCA